MEGETVVRGLSNWEGTPFGGGGGSQWAGLLSWADGPRALRQEGLGAKGPNPIGVHGAGPTPYRAGQTPLVPYYFWQGQNGPGQAQNSGSPFRRLQNEADQGLVMEEMGPHLEEGRGSARLIDGGGDLGQFRPGTALVCSGQDQTGVDARIKKLKMPIFEGEDAYGWIYHVERYFMVNGLSEGEKLMAAALFLEAKAVVWYRWSEQRQPMQSWVEFKDRLLERFRSSK